MTSRGAAAPALLAAGLLLAGGDLARRADAARDPAARAAGGTASLGAVDAVAVDLLWLRADALYAENRWPEMLAAYEAAGRVAPRLVESFEYRGFHLAYNLAGACTDPAARDRWVLEGVRVLDEGLRRNPDSADLRAYLGLVLHARSARWPSLGPRLRAARGRPPLDEAVDLLAAAVAAEPDDGKFAMWYTDALLTRGRRALVAAPAGAPAPAAAADFRRALDALRALGARVPPEGREAVAGLAAGIEALVRAAETSDPAERSEILRDFDRADDPPGK